MALTAGAISVGLIQATSVELSATPATDGEEPISYQWHRSTTSGFSPSGGTAIAGADSLDLVDTGLIPGTQYYYKLEATESGASPDVVVYDQASVVTAAPTQSPNQFRQDKQLGMIDLRFPHNTVSVLVDNSQATPLRAGDHVKMVDSVGGTPKVVGCAAASDESIGVLNYDIKSQEFPAGAPAEMSMGGNVMFLYATGPIARGVQVVKDLSTRGGVRVAAGATGANVIGWAYDKATAGGQLIRVMLVSPSFRVVS